MRPKLTPEELCNKHGICQDCGGMYQHHLDEPFASCACRTSEWAGAFTPYMQLQEALAEAAPPLTDLTLSA